jgi:hypothetical protein
MHCRLFYILKIKQQNIGEEALTSDDLKFGQSCFGALWSIFFEK